MKNAKQELIDFILSLNERQVDKILAHMGLLKTVVTMEECELVYSETFLSKMFGKGETA